MPNPIFDQLKRYLSIPDPDYGCMINGVWGSGKTYFLKKELLEALKDTKDETLKKLKIRYVSANGIKDFEEILNELKRQKIIPDTNSKVKIVGKFAGRVIDNLPVGLIANVIAPGSGTVVDTAVNTAKEGLKTIFKMEDINDLINAVSFNEKDIIIIDDIERVHKDCDLIGLLGEINTEFVEHHNIKTILVCDESEIENRFNGSDRNLTGSLPDYKASKEKCVRYTYLFNTDLESLLGQFVSNLDDKFISKETKSLIGDSGRLKDLNRTLAEFEDKNDSQSSDFTKLRNLRVVKHIIQTIAEVIECINDNSHKQLIFRDLCAFITINVLYYKYADKNNVEVKYSQATDMFINMNHVGNGHEQLRKSIIGWSSEKYGFESFKHCKLESAAVRDLIFKGIYEKDKIDSELRSQIISLGLDQPEAEDLREFTHYQSLEDTVFLHVLSSIGAHLDDNKFNLTQIINLIETFRLLLNRGYKFDRFGSHKEVSAFFTKYVNDGKAKSIVDFVTLRDIVERDIEAFSEPEYTTLKCKINQICDKREKSLDNQGIAMEVNEICSGTREFEKRHLRILLDRMPKSEYDKIQTFYSLDNKFKKIFSQTIYSSQDWLTTENLNRLEKFSKQALSGLYSNSIGKLKVIDMLKTIERFKRNKLTMNKTDE